MREFQLVDAAELATAYAVAQYAVVLDGEPLPLRVGEPAGDVEAYWPATRYAFITAWNPASQPRSDSPNETAEALLVGQLDEAGVQRQPAWARDDVQDWHEPGWLVADLPWDALDRLAMEFGQAAVLAWERGEPVRLRMLVHRPPGATAGAFTDWVE